MSNVNFPNSMRKLVFELSKLPAIGDKSAARIAYHLIKTEEEDVRALAEAIIEAKTKISFCKRCFSLAEEEYCSICNDISRDRGLICVVEKPVDVLAIERSGSYPGVYHVLHGLWSPMRGVSPEETKINDLIERVRLGFEKPTEENPKVAEIILATGTTVEGDATAMFIGRALSSFGVSITRIAQGMPKGGELEYADQTTLAHAISGRLKL